VAAHRDRAWWLLLFAGSFDPVQAAAVLDEFTTADLLTRKQRRAWAKEHRVWLSFLPDAAASDQSECSPP
jgi:hypothetical protein